MKVFLDACVLYPTVLREVLLGCAGAELYRPLWSPRVLEEWARAARKLPDGETVARGEIAALRARWPEAEVRPGAATEARMWLPDPNDVHVLAAASDAGADRLVTLNVRDFPRGEVAAEGIALQAPDAFLMELWLAAPDAVAAAVERVRATAVALSGEAQPLRPLLKRAKLPRLGKALEAG
ncbi:RSP_2648 family PIN domain-containing protein [Jannaschia seohaensis]|uniref:PIN domain-containing protein n=1 Tax=Jannaschia seohaensis TaxID=475081 RepID=A0A2Y9AH68_9RHOB|nr:PIN domain-containing protein [Jannaschia seohaensis]PWJ21340.1 PIN domain-containing protein [Jannaschia seohaensis]SSA41879.1 PIN domain-containing protein [Jannaschia seohaensis]